MTITPGQSRAARGLLGITQRDLAEKSGVSLRTIASFETERRQPRSEIVAIVRAALERGGIVFIDETRTNGVGVMLRKRRRKQ
jgi:transcriptional regulator with XRE-family HTH domain